MGLIRLILALSVVVCHSDYIFHSGLVGGSWAVEAFYIISGFYMSLILSEKYTGTAGSFKLFMSNRLLRLMPAYWVVLLLTLVLAGAIYMHSGGTFAGGLQPYIDYQKAYGSFNAGALIYLIACQLFLYGQDLIMFMGFHLPDGSLMFCKNFQLCNPPLYSFLMVPQAWTLSLEISFYLLAPFLLRRSLKTISIIIILSLALKIILAMNGMKADPWNYRFFPSELSLFLLGNISYRIYKRIRHLPFTKAQLNAVIAYLLAFIYFFYPIPFFSEAAKGYFFLASITLCLPLVFLRTRKLSWDNKVGELSYPIYICHLLIYNMIRYFHWDEYIGLGYSTTIISIVFSMLMITVLLQPIDRWRQRRIAAVQAQ